MQSQNLKYLGYGLGIGALIAVLFFTGIFLLKSPALSLRGLASTSTAIIQFSPTAQFTTTSTFPPAPASLPVFTPPPSPTAAHFTTELMITSGEIVISGPLSKEQQINLYEASLYFVSPTYEESRKTSVLINRAKFSDPSTTCGPLSIAILQRGGILGNHLIPHDFFLINPDLGKDREILELTFPEEVYEDTRYRIKLSEFNWAEDPLYPGDFVYIFSGSQGNFEHMLVINRIDSAGRAYSVTNYNTEQGFIIDEVMLYDPQDFKAGIFAQWTKREDQLLGSTGFAGFEVWRLKEKKQ